MKLFGKYSDFARLDQWHKDTAIQMYMGNPYHLPPGTLSKGQVKYTAALPVQEHSSEKPKGLKQGNLPSSKTYCLQHQGPYEHLGNGRGVPRGYGTKQQSKSGKMLGFQVLHEYPSQVQQRRPPVYLCQ